jgi:hypothetical protein
LVPPDRQRDGEDETVCGRDPAVESTAHAASGTPESVGADGTPDAEGGPEPVAAADTDPLPVALPAGVADALPVAARLPDADGVADAARLPDALPVGEPAALAEAPVNEAEAEPDGCPADRRAVSRATRAVCGRAFSFFAASAAACATCANLEPGVCSLGRAD